MGMFFLGSSFGRTLELLVSSFISAWVPYYSPYINKQEEAINQFGKAVSYYVLGICALLAIYLLLQNRLFILWYNLFIKKFGLL